jgi:heat shock protein HtpX
MNVMKTYLLMAVLTVLLIVVGNVIGGQQGMLIAFAFAIVMNVGSYWFSDKIVLASYRAQEIQPGDNPKLYRVVQELSQQIGIPMPRLYLIPSEQPNAFATGRNPQHAAVAVTEGIMSLLSEDELKGVLAHELAHVTHRDILIGTIAATIAGAISMIASMGQWGLMFGGGHDSEDRRGGNPIFALIMIIVAPLAAMLIQMAISRSREFDADEGGAKTSGNPLLLANALRKLDLKSHQIPMQASPSSAHLFIVNPLSGGGFARLFSTHPPIEERIARLEAMAHGGPPR